MNKLSVSAMVLAALFISACDKQEDVTVDAEESADVAPTLATVNGEVITQDDVDYTIERTFSAAETLFANEGIADKVLESLIASKAMAQSVKQDMSAEELAAIKRKVNAYEEELFIKEYLTRNAIPQPVTQQMVQEYYDANPDKFGGATIKVFEQLKAERKLTEAERDSLLSDQATIAANTNWEAYARSNTNKYPLIYQKATATQGLLSPQIDNALQRLSVGTASNPIFVDGIPVVLRVIEEKQAPPKPLHEVSADIRKSLAPLQLRKAVKQATEEVLLEVEVERIGQR